MAEQKLQEGRSQIHVVRSITGKLNPCPCLCLFHRRLFFTQLLVAYIYTPIFPRQNNSCHKSCSLFFLRKTPLLCWCNFVVHFMIADFTLPINQWVIVILMHFISFINSSICKQIHQQTRTWPVWCASYSSSWRMHLGNKSATQLLQNFP